MKPLMSVSPAQAEALFDAFTNAAPEAALPQGAWREDAWREDTWLDEDTPDDFSLFPIEESPLTALMPRTRQAA